MAVQVDSISRRMQEEDKQRVEEGKEGFLYRYKRLVSIPSQGMMDHSVSISERGFKTVLISVSMNEHSATKKLQFNPKNVNF